MQLPSRSARGRRAPMADINVTPLVDVMLVLLIIFMVTAPLMTAGVPVNLPDSRAKALDDQKKPVQLSIEGNGTLHLDDQEVSDAQLPARLERLAAGANGGEAPQIYLRADRSLDYGRVARVLGELNRAGLNRVALVSDPRADAGR
jgi:biopolymer transport protein TolR